MMKQVIFLFLLFSMTVGYCCSCPKWKNQSVLERINKTEQIFEGSVQVIKPIDEKNFNVIFLISKEIKGVTLLDTISIRIGTGVCDSKFAIGERWLIFANSNYTNICFGNFQLFDRTFNDIPFLELSGKYGFYYSKLQRFLEEISQLQEGRKFVEVDVLGKVIARGFIGRDGIPGESWDYAKRVMNYAED